LPSVTKFIVDSENSGSLLQFLQLNEPPAVTPAVTPAGAGSP
jgi:hypothetical protein